MSDAVHTFYLPCARGTELSVAHELKALGIDVDGGGAKAGKGIVTVRGPLEFMARANVFLRCANRVLLEIARWDDVNDEHELVERMSHVPFEDRLDAKGTFAVDARLSNCGWTNSHYAALRTKDVIVDRLRSLGRGRPDVDTQRPSIKFVLHWERNVATLSLDTTGEPLHQRGYRRGVEGTAPMKETLAAALLAIGHADVTRPFLDPCCGTGTLAIEQAWRALKRAPGRDRRFGFERWSKRGPELDRALALARNEARDLELKELPATIRLSDWHKDAIDDATTSIAQAGLEGILTVERVDARRVELPKGGVVCSNLPFGERLGQNRLQLDGFYRTLGEHIASEPALRVLLFTSHPGARTLLDLDKHAHLMRHWPLKSGDLDAHLYRWDLKRAEPPAA